MTDATLLDDIDNEIARFDAFLSDASGQSLPPYNLDSDGNPHPVIKRLYETNAQIWEMIVEQVRPELSKPRTPSMDTQLRVRHEALVVLSQAIEGLIGRCSRQASWIAD